MKKLSFLSLLLIAFTGCQIEELETPMQETLPETEMTTYYVAIDSEVETRTSLSNEGKILWSEGDKMNVFFGINNNEKDALVLMGGAGTENGSFYGPYIATPDDVESLHQTVIVYPYDENMTCTPNEDKTEYSIAMTVPSVQQYAKGSFGNGAYPMVGVTKNTKEVVISTKNVLSGMNVKIKGDVSISKIVLTSADLALAGPATVVAAYGKAPVVTVEESTALNTVELVCDGVQLNSEEATEFHATFAPCSGKITVTIYDTEGGYMTKTTKATDFTRNDIFQLPELTYVAEHSIQKDLANAFKNGGEYTLPMDVTVSEALLITGGKTLNLNLNGYTLTSVANLGGTNGCIQSTGAELNIANGKINNKDGYLFVTNGYNDKLHLELTDVDIKGSATSAFYFADGTEIVLNNVNLDINKGKGFYSFAGTPKGSIEINGGTYKTTGKIFDFKSTLPVVFKGNCLFSKNDYDGAQWVESGDDVYKWKPVAFNVFVGSRGFYSLEAAVENTTGDVEITILAGEYELPAFKGRNISIVGEDKATCHIKMSKSAYLNDASLSLKNVTYSIPTGLNYTEGAFAFIHHAANVSFTDCIINNGLRLNSKASIENCEFNVSKSSGFDGYALFYYGGPEVKVVNSTFNTVSKGIVAYSESAKEYNLTVEGCTFTATEKADKAAIQMHTELGIYGTLVVNNCVANGFADINGGLWNEVNNNNGTPTDKFYKVIDGVAYVASAANLTKALSQDCENIIINLTGDVTLKGGTSTAYGSADTKNVTINGNNNTLTYEDSYRTYIGLANTDAVLVLNNMNLTRYTTNSSTHWHNNNMKFECNTELNSVVFNKGITLDDAKKFTLNNVTINKDKVGTYAVFVTAGCDATFNGCTFTGTANGRRAIKVADEDVADKTALTKLSISNSTFNTASKAAVLVTSEGGADIIWGEGNDISNVAEDNINAVWVDEDRPHTFDLVTVTGCTKFLEGWVPPVANVNGTEYTDLKEAIAAAQEGQTVTVKAGEYTFPASSLKAGVTVECEEGTVFTGSSKLNIKGATVINAEFTNPTGSAVTSTINGTFKDCVFEGSNALRSCYAGDNVVFENCVFSGDLYGVHFDGGANDATFKGCTFSGFNAFGAALTQLTLEDCVFVSNGKSGYNGANLWGSTTIKNTTFKFDGTASNEWIDCIGSDKTYVIENCVVEGPVNGIFNKKYIFSRNDETDITINGVLYEDYMVNTISTAEELKEFAKAVNEDNNKFSGKTVFLTADINLNNEVWTPIGQTGATTFNGVFDGQNHTISNLNVDSEAQTGANYSSGLFGWVESHTAGHGHIKNVKIDGATIVGHHNCGALVGYITQETALVENCHVTGATITCTKANNDADGDKAGALIGNATVATPVKDCTAANSTVSGGRDSGQLIGAGKAANVTGCSATNVTVSANGTGTGANVRNEVIGRLL